MTTGEVHQAARDPDDDTRETTETRQAQETHTLVDALTRGQRRRVDEIDAKFEQALGDLDGRLAAGIERVGTRLDQIDGRLVGADARIDGLEERLTARLESLEAAMTELLRRLPATDR